LLLFVFGGAAGSLVFYFSSVALIHFAAQKGNEQFAHLGLFVLDNKG